MTLVALDLGTRTGYAISMGSTVASGVWDFKAGRFDGGGMRYLKFRRALDQVHGAKAITHVVFEEVRNHNSTDAAHVYGGLMATLTGWCEEQDPKVPYEGIPVGTIKKSTTGKGNSGKPEMIAAVESWGYKVVDDNHADALALLHHQLEQDGKGHPARPLPAPTAKVA